MSVTLNTSLGPIKLEIFCDRVPRLAENFLALAASGYYDGSSFHRCIKNFMIQGGDPSGTGKGGESIWGGNFEDQFQTDLVHDKRGVVGYATKQPDSNGSQFYITFSAQPHLNNRYSIFAQVIDGFETLDVMEKVVVGDKNRPVVDIKIESITIHANPLAQ